MPFHAPIVSVCGELSNRIDPAERELWIGRRPEEDEAQYTAALLWDRQGDAEADGFVVIEAGLPMQGPIGVGEDGARYEQVMDLGHLSDGRPAQLHRWSRILDIGPLRDA